MSVLDRNSLLRDFGGLVLLKKETSIWRNGKHIKHIDPNAFQGLTNITRIILYNNQIERIEPNTFVDLVNLKEMSLGNNKLRRIEANSFNGLVNLDGLYMYGNKIEEIDSNAFHDLGNLKWLSLYENKLKRVDPSCFKPLMSIVLIEIYGNPDLSVNILSYFNQSVAPADWFDYDTEEIENVLNVNGGFTTDWSLFLQQFSSSIHHKKETHDQFTANIHHHSSGESIDLSSLNNSNLSEFFHGLEHLRYEKIIDLTGKHIRRVEPSTFQGGLETLQELNLEENDIDSLDELTFRNLSNLRKLWLNNNKLRRIGANTFKGLTNLERLYLHGNRIELIDSNAFVDLSSLKKLLLWRNNLKRIDSKTFKGLTSLELLYINENQIEEIDSSAFDDLGNVKLLSLHDNKLRRLNAIGCFHALTNKVVLVEIYANRFPTKIVSFYKKQSAPIKWSQELPNIENDLAKNGGFLSDWSQFLLQFAKIDDQEQEPFSERRISTNIGEGLRRFSLGVMAKKGSMKSYHDLSDLLIEELFNDRYKPKVLLGKGVFGRVYLVHDETEGKYKAMKIQDKFDANEENEEKIHISPELGEVALKELREMRHIHHENVVRYFDDFEERFHGMEFFCVVTEYFENHDLKFRIKEARELNRPFSDETVLMWFLQATNGLMHLHSNKIIHRDIKPSNIFLDHNEVVKIGDLGLVKLIKDTKASTFIGSPAYMSPEQFRCLFEPGTYSYSTDIWSLGCVIYELIYLKLAFPLGQRGNASLPHLAESSIFSKLLQRMLDKEADRRITSEKLHGSLLEIKRVTLVDSIN